MIGGRRSLQAASRVIDAGGAPACALLPIHRQGPTDGQGGRQRPDDPGGRLIAKVRRSCSGRPLHQDEEIGERLSKTKALAIFSSDAISSSAYATEEIILAFILGGAALAALQYSRLSRWPSPASSPSSPSAIARCASRTRRGRLLLGVEGELRSQRLARRGIRAAHRLQPDGGRLDLVGGRTDRVGLPSPGRRPRAHRGRRASLITLANLRGVREAGNIFAVPTYLFMFSAFAMIAMGAYRIIVLGEHHAPPPEVVAATANTAGVASIFLLLRAFVGRRGADRHRGDRDGRAGLQAAESRNAATTLLVMAGVLATLFIGVTFLATNFAIYPTVPELFGHDGAQDRHRPGRRDRLRLRVDPVLSLPGLHGLAALPGREHQLRRVPAPCRGAR